MGIWVYGCAGLLGWLAKGSFICAQHGRILGSTTNGQEKLEQTKPKQSRQNSIQKKNNPTSGLPTSAFPRSRTGCLP